METKLFTPGPLTTSPSVKQAMMKDFGSRDKEFIEVVKFIRRRLVEIANPGSEYLNDYTTILLPGSGTYAVESVFANVLGNGTGKALILSNGAYGDRMATICKQSGYNYEFLKFAENDYLPLDQIEDHLKLCGSDYSLVSFVHCETSSGVINPLAELSLLIKRFTSNTVPPILFGPVHSGRTRDFLDAFVFVDAMSSFGSVPINVSADKVDFLVSSANKCLQGVPGFTYVLCKLDSLHMCKGRCTSTSFDLYEQWNGLETHGQFRFTPPTHSLIAFKQALIEYQAEGGLEGRRKRYIKNNEIIKEGMKQLGFQQFLDEKRHKGYIITSFFYLNDVNFEFHKFYLLLSSRGQVLYPGKVLSANCFRIGNIGHLFPEDCLNLLKEIEIVLNEMGVQFKRRTGG